MGVVNLTRQIDVSTFGVQRRDQNRTVTAAAAWIIVNLIVIVRRCQLGNRTGAGRTQGVDFALGRAVEDYAKVIFTRLNDAVDVQRSHIDVNSRRFDGGDGWLFGQIIRNTTIVVCVLCAAVLCA